MANYLDILNSELPRPRPKKSAPLALDLFAGCGGLALGFEAAGFRTLGYEMLEDACETYRKNLHGDCIQEVLSRDTNYPEPPDVIIGGPPCQPFSVGGHQLGSDDPRNGFPAYLAAIERFLPKVAVFENVRGMLYRGKEYLAEVQDRLEELDYVVEAKLHLATHFGVPQKRERLFVVAHRGKWAFPVCKFPTPFTAGDAIKDLLERLPPNPKYLTASMDRYVAKYEKASHCKVPRDLHLDRPSRTVTCRNLNGATGDMMRVKLKNGTRRRIVVEESTRLQSFPDWFNFAGNEGSQFNQVGNAVPPLMAKAIAKSVMDCLQGDTLTQKEIKRLRRPRLEQTSLF